MIKEFMFNRNPMLILSYLSKSVYGDNITSHVAKELSLGVGSVHSILKQFEANGVVASKKVGKSVLYDVKRNNPMINAFRIFDNLLDLDGLISDLKLHSRKIILFGSCASGRDTFQSDIDIFIIADEDEKDKILELINNYKLGREIKPIIVDMVEFISLEKDDAVFYKEIMKGIELWEVSNEQYR